ncbi:alpha-ketoglutarate decarboxylase [Paucihalobacter ruber]|uniref:alpha-ketoglutarate decarboxylase n=1 Tax=Paucihalobacter ruber TaxID=2567861 RepID=UPI001FE6140F|nr:alpha-ketoglutarate decarboxylase [Paucihalobacter ruber]
MFSSTNNFAQNSYNDNPFWSKVRYGGGIGLGFANDFFSATLAPQAIYEFNSQFALGVGLNGTYNSQKNVFNSTVVGASVIGLFNPIPDAQISAEFEQLNVNQRFKNNLGINRNYWYPALFLGAGYGNRNFMAGIRYDVLYNRDKSIYGNAWMPFVRVFF